MPCGTTAFFWISFGIGIGIWDSAAVPQTGTAAKGAAKVYLGSRPPVATGSVHCQWLSFRWVYGSYSHTVSWLKNVGKWAKLAEIRILKKRGKMGKTGRNSDSKKREKMGKTGENSSATQISDSLWWDSAGFVLLLNCSSVWVLPKKSYPYAVLRHPFQKVRESLSREKKGNLQIFNWL